MKRAILNGSIRGLKMSHKTRREKLRQRRRLERFRSYSLWIGIAAIGLVIAGVLIWPSVTPVVGEAVPVMESSAHVPEGEDPGPFNTDPPSSGRHYAADLEAGFYDENDAQGYAPFPEGYLVHNLEHGYIIFWYNCEWVGEKACSQLKDQVREAMDKVDDFKVIAFPWTSIDVPVVLTSWGKMQRFENFDVDAAVEFVQANRNKAPEPQAP